MPGPSIQLLRAIAAADAAQAAVATAWETVHGMRQPRRNPVKLVAPRRPRPVSATTRRLLTFRCAGTA